MKRINILFLIAGLMVAGSAVAMQAEKIKGQIKTTQALIKKMLAQTQNKTYQEQYDAVMGKINAQHGAGSTGQILQELQAIHSGLSKEMGDTQNEKDRILDLIDSLNDPSEEADLISELEGICISDDRDKTEIMRDLKMFCKVHFPNDQKQEPFFDDVDKPEDVDKFHKASTNRNDTSNSTQVSSTQDLETKVADAKKRIVNLITAYGFESFDNLRRSAKLAAQLDKISKSGKGHTQMLQELKNFELQHFPNATDKNVFWGSLDNDVSKPHDDQTSNDTSNPQPVVNTQEVENKIKEARSRITVLITGRGMLGSPTKSGASDLGGQFNEICASKDKSPTQMLQALKEFALQHFPKQAQEDGFWGSLDNDVSKPQQNPAKEPKVQIDPGNEQNEILKTRFSRAPWYFLAAGAVVVMGVVIYRYFTSPDDEDSQIEEQHDTAPEVAA